jgi:hypothetical protein
VAGGGAEAALAHADDGGPKLWLIHRLLAHRRSHPDAYGPAAGYEPLPVTGAKARTPWPSPAPAACVGLSPGRTADLVVAVNEVVTNSIRHASGRGTIRLWHDGDALVREARDDGRIPRPSGGRTRGSLLHRQVRIPPPSPLPLSPSAWTAAGHEQSERARLGLYGEVTDYDGALPTLMDAIGFQGVPRQLNGRSGGKATPTEEMAVRKESKRRLAPTHCGD